MQYSTYILCLLCLLIFLLCLKLPQSYQNYLLFFNPTFSFTLSCKGLLRRDYELLSVCSVYNILHIWLCGWLYSYDSLFDSTALYKLFTFSGARYICLLEIGKETWNNFLSFGMCRIWLVQCAMGE